MLKGGRSSGRGTQGLSCFHSPRTLAQMLGQYLSESEAGSSARFTDSLLTVIRQQRHLGTRVIVSTQEPTVVPAKYLDLCSFVIAHRFTSPKWLHMLAQHVSAAGVSTNDLFQKVCPQPRMQCRVPHVSPIDPCLTNWRSDHIRAQRSGGERPLSLGLRLARRRDDD